ncbi:MAG: ABC-F family ATP-binding cassette domain-containing protein [Planctomycetota bacterium]|nr:ABC-F family ATP-binding cassette domain-containing protein [Planctomycetota bacterium]
MSILALEDLKKHFAAQEVLKGASLVIDPGKKVGIVGRNGGGKTTLFRMITGEEHPDWGQIHLRKGARLGFVPQRPKFAPGETIRDHVSSGLSETQELLTELESIAVQMGRVEDDELARLMKEHDRLTGLVEERGGWDTERAVETVLGGIGLDEALWDRDANTLSGGEKNRTALARVLLGGHDLLMLDEPTNHLDLEGIEWLERYLKEMRGAVLIVSHDRRLLQNSVEQILELEFGQLVSYPGNYHKYLALKQERYDDTLRRYEQQQELLKREDAFIKKHMGSQRTAEAKGRAKKLTHVERIPRPYHDVRRPVLKAPEAARGGEKVLETINLAGGYDHALFRGANLRIGRGQRIGIVGPNGSGKSTLMRILAGRQKPLKGSVEVGHGAICSYYDQDTSHLRDDGTPFSELLRFHPGLTDEQVRSHLALFLFRGKEVDKSVAALSGGERARLSLAVLLLEKPSWMALDEPTNHLDLAGRTALEEMLSRFQGALLAISHDREFLDGLCDHIFEVGGGKVSVTKGNYSAWRAAKEEARAVKTEARATKAAAERKAVREKAAREEASAKGSKKPRGKGRAKGSGSSSGSGKVRNPYKFKQLEERIIKLEEKLGKLNASMASEEVYSDTAKVLDIQFQAAEVERELEEANEEWANWD